MITQIYSINRELMHFLILNREVFYKDKVFTNYIRIIPEDKVLIEQIREQEKNQNKLIPQQLRVNHKMFELTPQEIKEYESCKTDEEIAELVKKDAKSKGCLLISEVKR